MWIPSTGSDDTAWIATSSPYLPFLESQVIRSFMISQGHPLPPMTMWSPGLNLVPRPLAILDPRLIISEARSTSLLSQWYNHKIGAQVLYCSLWNSRLHIACEREREGGRGERKRTEKGRRGFFGVPQCGRCLAYLVRH